MIIARIAIQVPSNLTRSSRTAKRLKHKTVDFALLQATSNTGSELHLKVPVFPVGPGPK